MATRHNTLTVALDDDYRSEDLEDLISAISMMKMVHKVTAEETESGWAVEERVKDRIRQQLFDLATSLR